MWIYVWCLCNAVQDILSFSFFFVPIRCMFLMCTWKTHRLILIYMQLPLSKSSYSAKATQAHKNILSIPAMDFLCFCVGWRWARVWCEHQTPKRNCMYLHFYFFPRPKPGPINFAPSRPFRHPQSAMQLSPFHWTRKLHFFSQCLLSFRGWNEKKSVATWCTSRMIYHSHWKIVFLVLHQRMHMETHFASQWPGRHEKKVNNKI